jgi:hypothetical protein
VSTAEIGQKLTLSQKQNIAVDGRLRGDSKRPEARDLQDGSFPSGTIFKCASCREPEGNFVHIGEFVVFPLKDFYQP